MSLTVGHGGLVFLVLLMMVSLLVSETEGGAASSFNLTPPSAASSPSPPEGGRRAPSDLQYDFYNDKCPQAENIVRSTMAQIILRNNNATAQLLRLLFHDCFIEGCDASVLLSDDSNGNKNRSVEKDAIPNKTLKGFNYIDTIKEELENACRGIVSCADILVLATRDAIVLAGGPFYPVITGRRDSNMSYFAKATAEIPKPTGNISETLRLFTLRGFNTRETVALLGGHNIGKIGCEFIQPRLHNFMGTGQSDPSVPSDFLAELRMICDGNSTAFNGAPSLLRSRIFQALSSSISSGGVFGAKYFQGLLKGRGLLFADQQLMAHPETAKLVRAFASDDGTTFRIYFARAMVKMSNLGALTGSQGQVRLQCSRLLGAN